MKIRINKQNKDAYIKTLTDSLVRFIDFCNKSNDDKYVPYRDIAEDVLVNYNKISLNVLQFCFDVKNIDCIVYPSNMLRVMYAFRDYVYNGKELLSIYEQQEKSKKYHHFDFSVKKPKTLTNI